MRNVLLVALLLASAVLVHGQCGDGSTAYRQAVLADNPAGYWPLDDCGAPVVDVSGNDLNGTASGTSFITRGVNTLLANGHGTAVRFSALTNDGTTKASDRLVLPAFDRAPIGNTGYTIEFWFNLQSQPVNNQWPSIVSDRVANTWFTMIYIFQGSRRFRGHSPFLDTTFDLTLGHTYHFAFVANRTSGVTRMYIDGIERASTTSAIPANSNGGTPHNNSPLFIGRDNSLNHWDAGGDYIVDEVAYYNHPLSLARIEDHIAAAAVANPPPPTLAPTPAPTCTCPTAVTADYANTLVPDAAQVAYAEIGLNTNNWEVEFNVKNVLAVTNGHVIAAGVDARSSNVTASIEAFVSSPFDTASLWNPAVQCDHPLSGIDTPAASLGVSVQSIQHNCTRNYRVRYSLIDAAQRTSHCTLSNTAQNEIEVSCELQLNTIRAYDLTEAWSYLAKETVFRASITMPRNLPNEVGTLLHASLAKCSVYAAPDFYVDCRIPSLWNFNNSFSVTQSPSWIIDSSCAQTNGTDATYIRCDLQSISQVYTEVTATIAATVQPSGEIMNFNVNYSLPREETATATGSLASFVKSIGTKDGKFYYGNDDLLTLEIEVVETARLQITQLELFNSDSPVQAYDLRTTPDFELVETQNATFFVITFYPARKLDDSNFYLHGPHGVNVSFLFTAARRQEGDAPQAGDKGVVTYSGLGLKSTRRQSTAADSQQSTSTGLSQSVVAGIAAGALVAVVATVAAVVVLVNRRRAAAAPAASKKSDAGVTEEEV